MKRNTGLYQFLASHGYLQMDAEGIAEGKRLYRKTYQQRYKVNYRQKTVEHTLSCKPQEERLFVAAAKKHAMKVPDYIRQAALSYSQKVFLTPRLEAIYQVQQNIIYTRSQIERVRQEKKSFFSKSKDEQIEELLQSLERTIHNAFSLPDDLENLLANALLTKPTFIERLKVIVQNYDYQEKGQKSKGAAGRLLSYVSRENAIMRNDKGVPIIIKHNITGTTLADFKRAFETNERSRRHPRANQNYLYHEFVPFHPQDSPHLNVSIMEDLTRHYLETRAPNGRGIAVFHEDKHLHAHILLSAVELGSGRALHLTKSEFEKVKHDLQRYQMEKYPMLKSSIIDFEKEAHQLLTDEERQMKTRTGRPSRKEELHELLDKAFSQSLSIKEFHSNIAKNGLKVYKRNEQVVGIEDNRRYRFGTLGYTEEKIQSLSKVENRMNTLTNFRTTIESETEREIPPRENEELKTLTHN